MLSGIVLSNTDTYVHLITHYFMLHSGNKGAVGTQGFPGTKDSCQHLLGPAGPPGPDGSPGHPGLCTFGWYDELSCQLLRDKECRRLRR